VETPSFAARIESASLAQASAHSAGGGSFDVQSQTATSSSSTWINRNRVSTARRKLSDFNVRGQSELGVTDMNVLEARLRSRSCLGAPARANGFEQGRPLAFIKVTPCSHRGRRSEACVGLKSRPVMQEKSFGWTPLNVGMGVLWLPYKFGGGIATTFVFRGKDDALIVLSPGCGLASSTLDELKGYGRVAALVAINGFHHLGVPEWRQHFPDAKCYAPASAMARLSKKVPGTSFEALDRLAPSLGENAQLLEPDGLPGSAFAIVRSPSGTYWYVCDLLASIPELPKNLVFKMLMSMTDSAPGYKLFRPAVWLQVKDKKALAGWFDKQLTDAEPTVIVPAHGAPVQQPDIVAATRAQLARL
jgi:glyoxylase-like metal-dependent hydrolase (beta-lactamase superfamily II)